MMAPSPSGGGLDMIRIASFVLLLGSVNLMAQTTEVFDGGLLLHPQAICGPIRMQARMLDTSQDRAVVPHQMIGITLNNLKSTPIVVERITLHFGGETPTSGAPIETQSKVEVGPRQEGFFATASSVVNPVSYVELNSVGYSDGSSWQPRDGEVCKITPEPLRN